MTFEAYLASRRSLVEEALDRYVPGGVFPPDLCDAMRYSLLDSGKRIRPILMLAVADLFGTPAERVLPFAAAVEMIHTYTLIHDDLPAMDDDDYRRGKLTNHKVYGEAMAILAGDALLTEAFTVMAGESARLGIPPKRALAAMYEISSKCGVRGVVGGQVMDVLTENKAIDMATLEYIHTHKTGALILAVVRTGAILSGARAADMKRLTEYGRCTGLAFQIMDDILDVEGSFEQLGKKTGADELRHKNTYPSVLGMKQSKEIFNGLMEKAGRAVKKYGDDACYLRGFIEYLKTRQS